MINPRQPAYHISPASPKRFVYPYLLNENPASAIPPILSIVTPFYNSGEFLPETVQTVLQQSFQQWEWIIVNDASDDPVSLEILDRYRNSDNRIQVIDLPANSGPGAARNAGIRHSQTEYIVQLDSDNLLEPTAIEKWLWNLISYSQYHFVTGYSIGFGQDQYLWKKGFHSGSLFLEENQVDNQVLIRKSVLEQVGGYTEDIRNGLEDWDLWLKCAHQGIWGNTIPEYLHWYRRREKHTERWADWSKEGITAFRARFRQAYPDLWESGGFPTPQAPTQRHFQEVTTALPFGNILQKKKQRLLMVLPWLQVGGADNYNIDLIKQLQKHGWGISIITTLPDSNPWMAEFLQQTPDIFTLNNFIQLSDYPRFFHYFIRSRQIDAVMISHSEIGYHLLPFLRSVFPDLAILDYCHIIEEHWKGGGYPRISSVYSDIIDLTLTSSDELTSWMVNQGISKEKVKTCYINIDVDFWKPDEQLRKKTRSSLSIREDTVMLLYAARICEQKKPLVFGEVIKRLNDLGSNIQVVVAGDGDEMPALRDFIEGNQLDNVHLLGSASSAKIQELMAAADIFFLPSAWEGIALTLYEAMASGLPVVAADVGGQRELVTTECGFLVSGDNPKMLVKEYVEILQRLIADPVLRNCYGKAARQRVFTYFQLDDMGKKFDKFIQSAIEKRQQSSGSEAPAELTQYLTFQAVEYIRMSNFADQIWQEKKHSNQIIEKMHTELTWFKELADEHQNWIKTLENEKKWLSNRLHEFENYRWMKVGRLINRLLGRSSHNS
jgi:glycosyltransferase involved in cell wall biosynthesis